MKTVDTRGMKCPMPLIQTKKALTEAKEDDSIQILIDNMTSVKNVTHYLNDHDIPVETEKKGDIWELTLERGNKSIEDSQPEDYCVTEPVTDSSYVVLLAKNRIGEGSEELGEMLVGSLLESLKAQDKLPGKIIFMNSGIQLVTKDSSVLTALTELQVNGVEMIACGTCLNYFGKTEELAIGRVSNMFEIVEVMRNSGKVISI